METCHKGGDEDEDGGGGGEEGGEGRDWAGRVEKAVLIFDLLIRIAPFKQGF